MGYMAAAVELKTLPLLVKIRNKMAEGAHLCLLLCILS